jgi:hypothetical protein
MMLQAMMGLALLGMLQCGQAAGLGIDGSGEYQQGAVTFKGHTVAAH